MKPLRWEVSVDDLEARVGETMRNLARNIERANADPQAVLQGGFRGRSRSGAVTVWVDALGRVDQCHLAPDSVREGDERRLAADFIEAVAAARRAADGLDADPTAGSPATDPPGDQGPRHRRSDGDDDGWDTGGSILHPVR